MRIVKELESERNILQTVKKHIKLIETDENEFAVVNTTTSLGLKIVSVSFGSCNYTPEMFERYLDDLRQVYADNEGFGLIFDLTLLKVPSSHEYVQKQIDFLKTHRKGIEELLLWSAYISDSCLMKGVVELVFQVIPPLKKTMFVSSSDLQNMF